MNNSSDSYSRIFSNTELSEITGIKASYLKKIRRGDVNLEKSKYKKYLKNFKPTTDGWQQIADDPIEKYVTPEAKPNKISNVEVSKITGVSLNSVRRIKKGVIKRGSNAKYLVNYCCARGYWEKIGDKPCPKKRSNLHLYDSKDKDKIRDSEVSRKTGVNATTVHEIRVGNYKDSKFAKYLKNYVPNGDHWRQVGDLDIEVYNPDDEDPNRVTCTELSRRTGIHSKVLLNILHKKIEDPSQYFPYLTNYSCETGEWIQIDDKPTPRFSRDFDDAGLVTNKLSLLDLVDKYCLAVPKQQAKLHSALTRYFVPEIGGPQPKTARATSDEKKAALSFLAEIPVDNVSNILSVVTNSLSKYSISDTNKYSITSTIKQFTKHPETERIYKNPEKLSLAEKWSKCSGAKTRVKQERFKHRIPQKPAFKLTAKNPFGNSIFDDYINDKLQQEIIEIKEYYKRKELSKAYIDFIEEKILSFCGWLVRYKSIPLEYLSLESIIRFQKLNADISDFPEINSLDTEESKKAWEKYIYHKALVRERAFITARENVRLIEEYCNFIGNKASTAVAAIKVIIKIAKYLYRNEVSLYSEEYNSFNDVPIIKKLIILQNQLIKQMNLEAPSVPYEAKSEPWEVVVEVMNNLRELFHMEKNGFKYQRRETATLANDLQKFLIFGFLILLPPDRSRSLWDMRIDETLIKGVYDGEYFTLPNDSNINECRWYRYFGRRDYKTEKLYGKHIIDVPNFEFPDGRTFYWYIEKWLSWGREHSQKCNHNYFFRTTNKYKKPYNNMIWGFVTRTFLKYGYKPVPPHTLRNIYITWLNRNPEATAEIKASIALLQHHSVETQQKIYDKNSNYQKSQLGYEFHQESLKKMFWQI